MVSFVHGRLAPVPEIVLANARRALAPLAAAGARVVIAPHCDLAANLVQRGLFAGIHLVGTLDRNPAKIGQPMFNLDIHAYDDVGRLGVDAIVVANTRYHDAIMTSLRPVARHLGVPLVDLCAGYDHRTFRRELAASLDYRVLMRERPYEGRLPATLGVTVANGWGFGDKLCALSAARAFARAHLNISVQFGQLRSIVEAYGDDLLEAAANAVMLPENSELFHREKDTSPAGNYLGCYYLGLGLDFDDLPMLDLPPVAPPAGLRPGGYIALQARATWARPNLSAQTLQAVVDGCNLPVVIVGRPDPDYPLRGVDTAHMGDELSMLRVIRHASLVLTPRSASTHIASGYRVPTVTWVPDDGENWHLDYPLWPNRQVPVATPEIARVILAEAADLLGGQSIERRA